MHIVSNTFFLGDLKGLCERAPAVIQSASDRGDLYGSTAVILRTAFIAALMRDEPQRARDELTRAEAVWSKRREFLMQHYWSMMARLDILAYEGNGPEAYGVINLGWRRLGAAQMLRVQFSRVEALYRRARSALMSTLDSSQGASRGTRLRQVKRDSRTLVREGVDWGVGLGHLVSAGAAVATGDADRALASLTIAEERFDSAGMSLHAALSRRARGNVIGGERGHSLIAAGDDWLRTQGVAKPEAFSRMITGWY